MKWEDCAIEFFDDGGLGEIKIQNMTHEAWQAAFDYFLGLPVSSYTYDQNVSAPPASVNDIFANGEGHRSRIDAEIGGVRFSLHFFDDSEADVVFSPREICSQQSLDVLLGFMASLTAAVEMRSVLVPEGFTTDCVIFSCDLPDWKLTYHAPRFGTNMDNSREMSKLEVFWWLLKLNVRDIFRKK